VVFAFTSFVFYWYDSKVERRQSIVMNSATRSAAIVSSLFPSTVRDKLYPVQEKASSKKKHSTFTTEAVKGKDHMLGDQNEEDAVPGNTSITGSPIAELYPDTTVLFADIAGFTSWSSTRQPTEVFTLLETLYAGFDEIAKHRGVFKVETIGDCYVAVVGLPTPRKNHAVVMARFASDCRNKMQELTVELEKKLGEVRTVAKQYFQRVLRWIAPSLMLQLIQQGTKDLALRIGLNSGPTTAGVLRGEKSRFQLFGDVSDLR
jgi:class 3 adenylate cyclase